MASYPSSIKTFATIVDGVDSVLAAHQNDRGGEITAIETELGTNPKGSDASVKARLDRMDTVRTIIDGMKLVWNSATSITVGVGSCYAENGSFIDATSALTASGLSLSVSTWYHVYVYLSGSTPAVEVVTTAPAAWKGTAYSKTGVTSRRYVGSIRSDASGNVFSFLHDISLNMMLYNNGVDTSASPHRVLSGGTATTATSVSCSAVIPATSWIGIFRLYNVDASINVDFGDTSAALFIRINKAAITQAQVPLASGQAVYYKYVSTPSSSAFIDVQGYVFER